MQPRDCKRRGRRWIAHCYTQTQRINRNGNEPSIYYVMQMIFRWHKCSVIQKEVCVLYTLRDLPDLILFTVQMRQISN